MFSARLIRQFKLPRTRQFNSTRTMKEDKPVSNIESTKPIGKDTKTERNLLGSPMRDVSAIDKLILVWVKRYRNRDEIPNQLSLDVLIRAHTQARIKTCNYMIAFALLGFLYNAIMGKRESAAGRHIVSDRLKWHAEIEEKGRKEAAIKAANEAAAAGKL